VSLFLFNFVSYVFLFYVYVFFLLCTFCSVYSVLIVPTGTLRLLRRRFFRAFSSVVRQMPGYNSQRRGTARTPPHLIVLFCVLFVCKYVQYSHYSHRVSTQLQLTNMSKHVNSYLKARGRITIYTQLYLTCKNSHMFRLYIFSHHQAAYRTLKENYKIQNNKVVGGGWRYRLWIMYNYTKLYKAHENICTLLEDYVKLYRL